MDTIKIINADKSNAAVISKIAYENLKDVNAKYHSSQTMEMAYRTCSEEAIHSQFNWKTIFIAIANGEIVGTASLANFGKNGEVRWCVSNVFVKIEYHGLGIGCKLVKKVIETAYEKSAITIEVPSSISAIGFYKKCGFTESGLPNEDELTWMIQKL